MSELRYVKWLPISVFLSGEFHGQRSLVGYSPWDLKELDTTEWLTLQGIWKVLALCCLKEAVTLNGHCGCVDVQEWCSQTCYFKEIQICMWNYQFSFSPNIGGIKQNASMGQTWPRSLVFGIGCCECTQLNTWGEVSLQHPWVLCLSSLSRKALYDEEGKED